MPKMKFFTDKTVKNDFLLIKITDYLKNNTNLSQYKEIFIDPCVYQLKKYDEYAWNLNFDVVKFLDSLPENCYFSLDYPCDMNKKFQNEFLRKSWENAIRYCYHPNYIITVQFQFNDFWWFKQWFDKYNDLYIKSSILALGNICRILKLNKFMKDTLTYAFKNCRHSRIHIYGLTARAFTFAYNLSNEYNIKLSIDSLKWTRPCSTQLRLKYNKRSCNKNNRQEYFNEYIKMIIKKGIKLQNNISEILNV